MVRATPAEPVRRRTFFSSNISIQPRPSTPTSFGARASSNTVLAALSPPKEPLPNNITNKSKNGNVASHIELRPDASMHASSPIGKSTENRFDASRNTSSDVVDRKAKTSSNGVKDLAVGSRQVLPEPVRTRTVATNASTRATAVVTSKTSFWKQPSMGSSGSSGRDRISVSAILSPAPDSVGPEPGKASSDRFTSAASRDSTGSSTPIAPAPKSITTQRASSSKDQASEKRYMEAGFYCQDDFAKSPHKLVSKVLLRREAEDQLKRRKGNALFRPDLNRPAFPPLPYDYGNELFFGAQHDFVLPFNIRAEAENGLLDGKKKPAAYSKLRANVFPERSRVLAAVHAVCRCDAESGCGDNCINRIMSYLCGRDCPCGDDCTNKSLVKRKTPSVKVNYTGSRGFGLVAQEDIKEGDFVIDYRGEVISLETYQDRCQAEYASSRNFYALAYDQDEVIDAGARGNEARFINHSCNPNLVVHRFQSLGDGLEEYEVGMWASRDIAAGQELSYDYNFDDFGVAEGAKRVECRCGAPNCVGYLGRRSGEKSAKQIALDIEAEKVARAKVAEIKAKRAERKPGKTTAALSDSGTPSASAPAPPPKSAGSKKSESSQATKSKPTKAAKPPAARSRASAGSAAPAPPPAKPFVGILIGGRPIAAKIAETLTERPQYRKKTSHVAIRPASSSSDIAIPPPVEFYRPESPVKSTTRRIHISSKSKGRQSLPAPPVQAESSKAAKRRRNQSDVHAPMDTSSLTSPPEGEDRELSPVPLFVPLRKKPRKTKPMSFEAGPGNQSVAPTSVEPDSEAEQHSYDDDDFMSESPTKGSPGWGGWLKKKAGEQPWTLEQWKAERHAGRRGIKWMEAMVAEYGCLPSKGNPGQTGLVVPADLLESKRKEAVAAGIDITAKSKRPRAKAQKQARASEPALPVSNRSRSVDVADTKDHRIPAPDHAYPNVNTQLKVAREEKVRAKQEAIKARNGAPMGWAYVAVPVDQAPAPAAAVNQVHHDLPRSSRRRATINYHED